jgi:hypothetical protein
VNAPISKAETARLSVVTAGRPLVPTTTTLMVCLVLLDQVLVQIACR